MADFNNFKEKITQLFTQHPLSVGETYSEHFKFASWTGFRLFYAGLACMIHSVFPFIFIHTASNTLEQVNREMQERKK